MIAEHRDARKRLADPRDRRGRTRDAVYTISPNDADKMQLDEGHAIGREFIISGRDTPTLLDPKLLSIAPYSGTDRSVY